MAIHANAEIEVVIYPRAAIPRRVRQPLVIADSLGERMTFGQGDSNGIEVQDTLNPTVDVDWMMSTSNNQGMTTLTGVDFVRFLKNGMMQEGASINRDDEADASGYILRARDGFLDCKIGTTSFNTALTDLNFDGMMGTWKTVKVNNAPDRTAILNTGADTTHSCRTRGNIPADRSLRCDVDFSGQSAAGPVPQWRWILPGGEYSILGVDGQPWQVMEHLDGTPNNQWRRMRRLEAAGVCDLKAGSYLLRARLIAGRMVISVNGMSFHFVKAQQLADQNVSNMQEPDIIPFKWRAAPMQVNCYNVRARCSFALIKYADAADSVYAGVVERIVPRRTPLAPGTTLTGYARGYRPLGATINVVATLDPNNGNLQYSASLAASAAGIHTPFLKDIFLFTAYEFSQPNVAGIDAGPAVLKANLSMAMPPIAPGTTGSVTIDLNMLQGMYPRWRRYLKTYNPIRIRIRHENTDDTAEPWQNLFWGYIQKQDRSSNGINDAKVVLQIADPIMRLMGNNARITERFPPLDFLFFTSAEQFTHNGVRIMGSQCIKFIADLALGQGESQYLNGNGNGERFMPASHYPLWSSLKDQSGYLPVQQGVEGKPPARSGFLFPPPFDDDALTWMQQIASLDHAILGYMFPDGPTASYPRLCYGRPLSIIGTRIVRNLPDGNYNVGDVNKLLLNMEVSTRPEKDINAIRIYAGALEGAAAQLMPALRIGIARLAVGDVNAMEKTWERILIVRQEFGRYPGFAEWLANTVMAALADVKMLFPRFTFRGDASWQWGDGVAVDFDATCPNRSALTMDVHNETFRVERVEHDINMEATGADQWTTTVYPRPLSAQERAALGVA